MNDYTSKMPSAPPLIAGENHPKGTEAFPLFKSFWDYLASVSLTPTQGRVLYKMLSYMDCENWIKVSQTTLAEDLNIEPQNIQPAVKRLVELEIIEMLPDPQDRRRKHYRLSARFGWKENSRQWNEYIAKSILETSIIPKKKEDTTKEPDNSEQQCNSLSKEESKNIIEACLNAISEKEEHTFRLKSRTEQQGNSFSEENGKMDEASAYRKHLLQRFREQTANIKTIDETDGESFFEEEKKKFFADKEKLISDLQQMAKVTGYEKWSEDTIAVIEETLDLIPIKDIKNLEVHKNLLITLTNMCNTMQRGCIFRQKHKIANIATGGQFYKNS